MFLDPGQSQTTDDCHAGWYCILGSYLAEPIMPDNITDPQCTSSSSNNTGGQCWPGTYCPVASDYPTLCTAGMYCEDFGRSTPNGLCQEGFYCPTGTDRPDPIGTPCTVGHYCEQGSNIPTPCPQGTYSNTTHNPNDTYCLPCTEGFYCEGPGNHEYTGECLAHYYCPSGQFNPAPSEYNCTIGHFCEANSAQPEPCVAGEYQDEELSSSCKTCPVGR